MASIITKQSDLQSTSQISLQSSSSSSSLTTNISVKTRRTPMKAIRAKCLDCCVGQAGEVKYCPITTCPLYDYRMGHRPTKNGVTEKGEEDYG